MIKFESFPSKFNIDCTYVKCRTTTNIWLIFFFVTCYYLLIHHQNWQDFNPDLLIMPLN